MAQINEKAREKVKNQINDMFEDMVCAAFLISCRNTLKTEVPQTGKALLTLLLEREPEECAALARLLLGKSDENR